MKTNIDMRSSKDVMNFAFNSIDGVVEVEYDDYYDDEIFYRYMNGSILKYTPYWDYFDERTRFDCDDITNTELGQRIKSALLAEWQDIVKTFHYSNPPEITKCYEFDKLTLDDNVLTLKYIKSIRVSGNNPRKYEKKYTMDVTYNNAKFETGDGKISELNLNDYYFAYSNREQMRVVAHAINRLFGDKDIEVPYDNPAFKYWVKNNIK